MDNECPTPRRIRYRFPRRFVEDQLERELDIGSVEAENGRYIYLLQTESQVREMLSDTRHFATPPHTGWCDYTRAELIPAAKRLLPHVERAMRKFEGDPVYEAHRTDA